MDIERYNLCTVNGLGGNPEATTTQSDDGEFVCYDDYSRLKMCYENAIEQIVKSELSRTELIKQNQSLAAENERLENNIEAYVSDKSQLIDHIENLEHDISELQAVIKAAQEQEPVAWLHEQRSLVDVVTHEIKKILRAAHEKYGEKAVMHGHLDRSEHFTIPLYRDPVPAQSPASHQELMQAICEQEPADPNRERTVCVNYDWLYEFTKPFCQPAVAVPENLDRETLRAIVDKTWNQATESLNVPSTKWADQIIDFVLAAPPSNDRCPSHEPVEIPADCLSPTRAALNRYGDSCRLVGEALHEIYTAYGVQDSGVVDHE